MFYNTLQDLCILLSPPNKVIFTIIANLFSGFQITSRGGDLPESVKRRSVLYHYLTNTLMKTRKKRTEDASSSNPSGKRQRVDSYSSSGTDSITTTIALPPVAITYQDVELPTSTFLLPPSQLFLQSSSDVSFDLDDLSYLVSVPNTPHALEGEARHSSATMPYVSSVPTTFSTFPNPANANALPLPTPMLLPGPSVPIPLSDVSDDNVSHTLPPLPPLRSTTGIINTPPLPSLLLPASSTSPTSSLRSPKVKKSRGRETKDSEEINMWVQALRATALLPNGL
jgi:hypothetical protein